MKNYKYRMRKGLLPEKVLSVVGDRFMTINEISEKISETDHVETASVRAAISKLHENGYLSNTVVSIKGERKGGPSVAMAFRRTSKQPEYYGS